MNNQRIFTAIAIVAVVVIGLLIYNNSHKNDVASDSNTAANANTEATNSPANSNTDQTSANTDTTMQEPTSPDGNDVQVYEVTFDGKAFSPSQLEINNGDVVIFKNASNESFWPASGPHPTHTNYPEFDPKKAIAAGQSWQFKFTKSGTWPYHDHLNSSIFGKIIVK